MRVVALVLVVAIHCDHWPYQSSGFDRATWATVDLLCRVSVPLFLLLSGFLLAYGSQETLPLRQFLRRRLGRSLLPWVVWMPVYTVVGCLLTGEITPTPEGIWTWWALGGGHLWYLLLVPQVYLVFQAWPRSDRGIWVAAAVSVVVQVALCAYRLWAPAASPLGSFLLAHGYQVCPLWIGYFGLGVAFGRWRARHAGVRLGWTVAALSWAAVAGGVVLLLLADGGGTPNASYAQGTGAFLLPTLIPLTVAVFVAVAVTLEAPLGRWPAIAEGVGAVSRYALGIYIVHEALTYLSGPLQYLPAARAHLGVAVPLFGLQVVVTLVLAYAVSRVLAAGPLAITIGLPPRPLRWSRWRRPLAI